jgi:putative SOS response-associated peptidase YedK
MCNLYRLEKNIDAVRRLFADAGLPLDFPEGIPNLQPRDVRITDRAPIVRFNAAKGQAELVERRWSWPSPSGKPVFNMRSDGREFGKDRCLVIADGFFEYTASADPNQKRKDRHLFTPPANETFAIAGLVRSHPDVGEAFTLLTVPAGAEVAPYHHRQVALLFPPQWRSWLDHSARSKDCF